MRADVEEAARRFEVREAARGWQRAGAIDEATRAAIDAAYPDDRARLGPVFRVLVFGFTIVALNSCFGMGGLVIASGGESAGAGLLIVAGLVFLAATEYQIGPMKRAQGGTESATAFLGLSHLTGGVVWLLSQGSSGRGDAWINAVLVVVLVLFAAAAFRWGYLIFAGVAVIAGYLLLARGPFGRVLWMVLPVIATPLLLRAGDAARVGPPHRRCLQTTAVLSLVFLYLAVHIGSWDEKVVEIIAGHWHTVREPRDPLRWVYVLATALVPVLTLGWGIGARRRLLIDLGLVGVLASLVTLRFYVHVAPLYVVLLLGGVVAIGIALALRGYLDSGPGKEQHGFTAEPLFEDPEKRSALEVGAAVVSLSPEARPTEGPGFKGGGGRSGGGGATGSF